MQYFTPQLYQQFNSLDEAEAERANEAWEQAILSYKQRLDSVRDRLPSQVIALSALCLHDAEVIKREELVQSSGPVHFSHEFPLQLPVSVWSAVAVISLRLGGEILSLFYSLYDRVRPHEAPKDWRFSTLREHWLYDEVEVHEDRRFPVFTHSILLSTGVVLDIPFTSVVTHRFPVPQTGTSVSAGKKTA